MLYQKIETISELIAKSLAETLSPWEQKLLDNWLEDDPRNRQLYDRVSDPEYTARHIADRLSPEAENAYTAFTARIRRKARRLRWGVAAATAACLALGLLLFHPWQRVGVPMAEAVSIPPGHSQAVLTLSDGEQVELSQVRDSIIRSKNLAFNVTDRTLLVPGPGAMAATSQAWHSLQVPRGGEYRMVLPDGTAVWLNAETTLSFPSAFPADRREVRVTGEAYFEVAKDPARRFLVSTPYGTVEVLGTSFNVRCYPDECHTTTTLVEGSLRFVSEHITTRLEPGYQCTSTREHHRVNKVDLASYVSWKNGYFFFKDSNLEDISNLISRWYNVRFVFEDPQLKHLVFNGSIPRYEDLDRALELLEIPGNIAFHARSRVIEVRKK